METILDLLGQPEMPRVALVTGALALYMAFLWAVTRLVLYTHEDLQCPRGGRRASVTFLRGPDGFSTDVVRCSLLPHGVTCAKRCLRAA
jgi:hypothetical protein